jgi:hypothetical protein
MMIASCTKLSELLGFLDEVWDDEAGEEPFGKGRALIYSQQVMFKI